jgi:hypothetical protein
VWLSETRSVITMQQDYKWQWTKWRNHLSTAYENCFGMLHRYLMYEQQPCTLSAIYVPTDCNWCRHYNQMAVHSMRHPFTVNLNLTTQMNTMNSLLLHSLLMRTYFILLVMPKFGVLNTATSSGNMSTIVSSQIHDEA